MGAQVAGVATRRCPVPPAGLFCSPQPRQECQECEIPARCPVVLPPLRCPPHLRPRCKNRIFTRASDVHSHTSCYQEKTLSQRLEWALINRVSTGASLWGRGGKKAPTPGRVLAGGWQQPPERAGGERRVPAQPCHLPVVPRPLLSLLAEPQGGGENLYRGEHPAPWRRVAPSSLN